MQINFSGKTAIVTGGAGAIGLATANELGTAGAKVVLVDINADALENAKSSLIQNGVEAESVVADVSDASDTRKYVDFTVTKYGRIDAFFNNAGIEGKLSPIDSADEQIFDKVIAVNLRGMFLGLRHVLPVMLDQGYGAIVNTGSLASERGLPGGAAYIASKHAAVGLTRTAVADIQGKNVRINCVMPGMVDTPLLRNLLNDIFKGDLEKGIREVANVAPLRRCANPEEIANAVCFLLSDAASYINGTTLAVDGGALAIMSNSG